MRRREFTALLAGSVRSIRLIVWLVLACVSMMTGNLRAQEVGNPNQGLRIARTQCAECHLVENMVGFSPNRDAPPFEKIANIPGMSSAALSAALQTSHKRMPNVIIKGSDLSDVISYILSLNERR
jgi:mono/diheme cytochrome c family protein